MGKLLSVNVKGEINTVECEQSEILKRCQKLVNGYVECVYLGDMDNGVVMLVDEDGYLKQKQEVNRVATLVYSALFHEEHFILGDVVFAFVNGEDLTTLPDEVFGKLKQTLEELAPKAQAVVVPDNLPEPKCEVYAFDTVEQMMNFLQRK